MNELQKKAAEAPNGYVQIIAGPGTGKTVTLIGRIVELIRRGIPPEKLYVMSFTRAAAQEIRERVATTINDPSCTRKIPIGTFHSLSMRIMRQYGPQELRSISILGDHEKRMIIKNLMIERKMDYTVPHYLAKRCDNIKEVPKYLDGYISKVLQLVYGETEEEMYGAKTHPKIVDFARAYFARLKILERLDFDGLLLETLKFLRTADCPVQDNIAAILVDEFQDTSTVQLQLMLELSRKCANVTVVGDPDQSIYGFRYANPQNFELMHEKTNCHMFCLEDNYRSEQPILDASFRVIECSERYASNLKLVSRRRARFQTPVQILKCHSSSFGDVSHVVAKSIDYLLLCGVKPHEICVLSRTSNFFSYVESAFMSRSIPLQLVGGKKNLTDPLILGVISFLRVSLKETDSLAIEQSLEHTKPKVSPMTISGMLNNGILSLDTVRAHKTGKPGICGYLQRVETFMKSCRNIIRQGMAPEKALTEFITEICTELNCSTEFLIDTIAQFKDVYIEEGMNYGTSVEETVEFFTEYTKLWALGPTNPNKESNKDSVTVSTIHSAKGLEWPVVFVCNYGEKSLAMSSEEVRLMYVALTRAKTMLCVTTANDLLAEQLLGDKQKPKYDLQPNFEALSDCVERKVLHKERPKVTKTTRLGSLTMIDGFEFGSEIKDSVQPSQGVSKQTPKQNQNQSQKPKPKPKKFQLPISSYFKSQK